MGSDYSEVIKSYRRKYYKEMYGKAVSLVKDKQYFSVSFIQRHLRVPYSTAQVLVEMMERDGVPQQLFR